jgi:hypothetical protein
MENESWQTTYRGSWCHVRINPSAHGLVSVPLSRFSDSGENQSFCVIATCRIKAISSPKRGRVWLERRRKPNTVTLSNRKYTFLCKARTKSFLFQINTTAQRVSCMLHVSNIRTSLTQAVCLTFVTGGLQCVSWGLI